MIKAILIIVLVVGVVLGGLMGLRSSGRVGMPDEEVLKRAAQRARERAASEDRDGDQR